MNKTAKSDLSILIIVVVFSVLIGLTYAFFLPHLFPGYKTIWIGLLGVFVAAMTAGYIGYKDAVHKTLLVKIFVSFSYAAIVACFVIFLSWFIIANTYGE